MPRTLFITPCLPHEPELVYGVYQRMEVFLRALASISESVDCLFLLPDDAQWPDRRKEDISRDLASRWPANTRYRYAECLTPRRTRLTRAELYGRSLVDYRRSPSIAIFHNAKTLRAIDAMQPSRYDTVFAHRLGAMSALSRCLGGPIRTPVFFDLDDVEHRSLARKSWNAPEWPLERLTLLQVPALMYAERKCIGASAATFVCSEGDRRYLERLYRTDRVHVVPNSVPIPDGITPQCPTAAVLFVGAYSYKPNADAAQFLIREIWPSIRNEIPDARLVIVGKNPERIPAYRNAPEGVRFTGFVASVATAYAAARVVCCPILSGAGTRIKIIEAAAHGRAIVSTPVGAEGLDFIPGEEIAIASSAADLAARCVSLLKDPAAAQRMGTRAASKAKSLYEKRAIIASVAQFMERPGQRAEG